MDKEVYTKLQQEIIELLKEHYECNDLVVNFKGDKGLHQIICKFADGNMVFATSRNSWLIINSFCSIKLYEKITNFYKLFKGIK